MRRTSGEIAAAPAPLAMQYFPPPRSAPSPGNGAGRAARLRGPGRIRRRRGEGDGFAGVSEGELAIITHLGGVSVLAVRAGQVAW
jgi:hypothetical protein